MKNAFVHALAVALLIGIADSDPAHAGTTLDRELVGNFTNPMYITHAPGDASRIFVAERGGVIRVVKNGAVLPTPFLNLSSVVDPLFEGGLLGLAFHPEHARNGYFYVHYTRTGLVSVVRRFTISANPDVADSSTGLTLLEQPQPAPNHNGGWIDFGPNDGFLYIAFGDGGFSGSGQQRAQDITDEWLGKILRLDVDGDDFPTDPARNYAIPSSNPFVGQAGDDEIWALGLRNPFRCGFDRATGDLYIGDVGEWTWEEIDHQPANSPGGVNYGWGCMEGLHCLGTFCTCNGPDLTLPIHEYVHASGNCSVTGGSVYRGCAIPDLVGTYFFADYCSGQMWSFRYDGSSMTEFTVRTAEIGTPNVAGFGEDANGELYIASLAGSVYRIVAANPPPDTNENGVPDSCEDLTIGDLNDDGFVNVQDLLVLLGNWGPCIACSADLDMNGTVGIEDLLLLLGNWG